MTTVLGLAQYLEADAGAENHATVVPCSGAFAGGQPPQDCCTGPSRDPEEGDGGASSGALLRMDAGWLQQLQQRRAQPRHLLIPMAAHLA